ncbi:MAG: 1-acyl-sn-glycerol-3-phosphate acyltransferase [Bacteroidales bacterium]|nr:1-acyl-sn-glycerol-3-phosphate acyltransferase [Bacteroidales bacterium]MBR5028453.1 1-acyl-sn-glycerol-3-phosphate acyltransferase [Bacteroidales bacterium]
MENHIPDYFDEMRPYYDSEVPAAIRRMADSELFPFFIKTIYPEKDFEEFKQQFLQVKTVNEWHDRMWFPLLWHIIGNTSTALTVSGLENISKDSCYMFVSNHRDITLDASILNALLGKNGYRPAEITFGSNLMINQFVTDLGKISKMFRLVRGGNRRDFYKNSLEVSTYMRYAITTKHESVWIAQRNGRTKDGNDASDQGLLKMFAMSSDKPFADNFAELNICPVAISYEYEPCDFMKVAELCVSMHQKYVKSPMEDMLSIRQGIFQNKGNIHLSVCKPVTTSELQYCDSFAKNDKFASLAQIIDKKIHSEYKLFKNNYIAYDLLEGSNVFANNYTAEEKAGFQQYMDNGLSQIDDSIEKKVAREVFLKIYANPVINQRKSDK